MCASAGSRLARPSRVNSNGVGELQAEPAVMAPAHRCDEADIVAEVELDRSIPPPPRAGFRSSRRRRRCCAGGPASCAPRDMKRAEPDQAVARRPLACGFLRRRPACCQPRARAPRPAPSAGRTGNPDVGTAQGADQLQFLERLGALGGDVDPERLGEPHQGRRRRCRARPSLGRAVRRKVGCSLMRSSGTALRLARLVAPWPKSSRLRRTPSPCSASKRIARCGIVGEQDLFADFDVEPVGRQAGGGERAGQHGRGAGAELPGREVDREAQVARARPPLPRRRCGRSIRRARPSGRWLRRSAGNRPGQAVRGSGATSAPAPRSRPRSRLATDDDRLVEQV